MVCMWFVCGNFDVFPNPLKPYIICVIILSYLHNGKVAPCNYIYLYVLLYFVRVSHSNHGIG